MLRGGKLLDRNDIIYFGNLTHGSRSVQHMGDNLTGAGEGDDEQIVIELHSVPAEYDRIVFVVNIYQAVQRHQHFGMIQNAFIRIVDARNNQELCRYNLSENYDNMTAMIFGEALPPQRRVEVQRRRPGHHGPRPGPSCAGAICTLISVKHNKSWQRGANEPFLLFAVVSR